MTVNLSIKIEGKKLKLNPQQAQAIEAILPVLTRQTSARQASLVGYAGTGKTFTVQKLCRDLTDAGYSIAALAMSHKALAVLREAMPDNVALMTIASALGWRFQPKTQRIEQTGRHKLAGYDVVIVDEASMVGEIAYSGILRATESIDARILWVGDPAQLPPINEPDSPALTDVTEQARLTAVVRQAEGDPIIAASMYLRRCLENHERPTPERLMAAGGGENMILVHGGLGAVAEYVADARRHGVDARAIAWTNPRVVKINKMAVAILHPPGSTYFSEGDPVTFGTSYTGKPIPPSLYGESIGTDTEGAVIKHIGIVESHGALELRCHRLEIEPCGLPPIEVYAPDDSHTFLAAKKRLLNSRARYAQLERDAKTPDARAEAVAARYRIEEALGAAAEDYADIRHIYAGTAHKAQGSTYDAVVIDWQNIASQPDTPMLCRMLYVAITRPRKYLVIVA